MKEPMLCSSKVFADAGVLGVRIDGLKLVSEMNRRDHWAAVHRRKKVQQTVVMCALRGLDPTAYLGAEIRITLTRQGRKMDTDGNVASFKHTQDAVAYHLHIDDGDARLEWRYEQRRGKVGLEIRFEQRRRGAA